MSQLRNLIFHHDSPISSLSKSPSSVPSPPRNHQNSSSPSSQSTPRRRFKRKCTNVKNVETKEQKEVQRMTGIDAGLVRLTKDGDMVNVPWQDPAPSTVYRHQNTRQERSCLDHFDEPVFSSFSGKFACQRQPLKLELGMPLPQEKLSPAQKRAIQHKKLEAEEADAEKILPPPARPPRLPIHVTTNDDDDDYVEDDDGDDYYYYGYDDQDCSTGTLSNMPPSTKNDAVEHGTPVKQRGGSHYVSPAASPSVRTYHMNKKKEREELERQLHHLQHYVGAAASIPRPSHSPRALRQFMTPARSAAEILHSVGDSRSASRASSSARHTSRPASAVVYQSHQRNKTVNDENNNDSLGDGEVVPVPHSLFGDSKKFQEAFDSPGRRSSAPLQVTDLVNIVKRPRPSSASVVMAISEKITSAARLRKQVAESQQQQQPTEEESIQKHNEETPTPTKSNRNQHQQQRVNESFRSHHTHQPQSGSTPPSRASTASISRPLSAAVGSPSSSRTKQHNQPQHRYSPPNNNKSKSPQRKVDMIAKLAASGSFSMMTSPNDNNNEHQLESPPRSFGSTVLRGDLSQQRKNHQQLASKQRGMNTTSPSSDQQNINNGGSFYGRTSRGGNTTPSEQGRTVNNSGSSFGRVGSSGPMTSPRFGSMTFGRLHQTVTIVEDEK